MAKPTQVFRGRGLHWGFGACPPRLPGGLRERIYIYIYMYRQARIARSRLGRRRLSACGVAHMGGEPCASERSAKAAGEGRTLEGRRGVGGERRRGSQAKGRMARGARVHETGGAPGVFLPKKEKKKFSGMLLQNMDSGMGTS